MSAAAPRGRLLLAGALLLAALSSACATLTLPAVIGDHMVLQRDSSAVIWGWTDAANSPVSLSFNGVEQSTTAGADGSWRFDLGSVPAGSGAVIVVSDHDDKAALRDVAFGDVLLCAGQSNMEMTLNATNNATAEIADSINYPLLRMFTTAKVASLTPLDDLTSKAAGFNWTVSGPEAFQGGVWGTFSATCYFTGRGLYRALGGQVPVGLVASDWGGTVIEAWSTPDALAKCPANSLAEQKEMDTMLMGGDDGELSFAVPPLSAESSLTSSSNRINNRSRSRSIGRSRFDPPPPNTNSVLWNGMIAPLLPMRFAMVIWYQAESNRANPAPYACRFPAMIQDWRAKFGLALPFFFVQVAAYAAGGANWPVLQVAQTAALGLPQVGFATAMDLGDPTSPAGAIHPRDKQSVGARLVRSILALVYGQQLVHTGPQVASFSVDAAAPNAVTIALVPGASSQGLELRSTEGCDYATGGCCQQNPFMLGTNTGAWIRASSVKLGDSSLVVSVDALPQGQTITAINYSFQPYAQCCVYNSEGLPMTVFQSEITATRAAAGLGHGHGHRKQRIVLTEN